jgi:hypothetical protein
MKKLSEVFLEMSQRAADLEKRAAAQHEEDRQQFEADRAEARKSVAASQAAFEAKLYGTTDAMAAHWREVQQSFNSQVATARSKAAERKAADDLGEAQFVADLDETNAQIASEFAQWAAAEANAAMLDAAQSHAYAKSLENPASTAATTPQKTV